MDCASTLQEKLVRTGVLPERHDFDECRELVDMQTGNVLRPIAKEWKRIMDSFCGLV